MGRRRPHWPKDLVGRVYDKSSGKCHHCGCDLPWNRASSGRRTWHVDHYPVAYRDIEGQVLWGVRDPLDESNLVASCAPCNLSHEFERDVCCGHTQLRCRRSWAQVASVLLASASTSLLMFYAGFVVATAGCGGGGDDHNHTDDLVCICD